MSITGQIDARIGTIASGIPRVCNNTVEMTMPAPVMPAVRRMTSLPARTFGLQDRSLIRVGIAADLVLLDPERVADTATLTKPHSYSVGFALVLVNSGVVVEDDTLTGERPGTVLRHLR